MMQKQTETELIKESWKKIPSFFKNNPFMKKVVEYIIENEIDSALFASTSLQMLNVSSGRKHPTRTLRIDASNVEVSIDYFEKDQFMESKILFEEEAFSAVITLLNSMLKNN
jgi:hypothetical protein